MDWEGGRVLLFKTHLNMGGGNTAPSRDYFGMIFMLFVGFHTGFIKVPWMLTYLQIDCRFPKQIRNVSV